MNTFTADTQFPPSLAGLPFLTMLVVMGFWIAVLLCLQWLYSIIDDAHDNPAPARHPLSYLRKVKVMILLALIAPTLPRGILLISWSMLSPFWREALALGSWVVFVPAAGLLAWAWWLDRAVRPMERRTVALFASAEIPQSTRVEKTRGIIIFALIFVVAFATTFIRPSTDVPHARIVVERR